MSLEISDIEFWGLCQKNADLPDSWADSNVFFAFAAGCCVAWPVPRRPITLDWYRSGFRNFITHVHLLLSAQHGGTWKPLQRIPSLTGCYPVHRIIAPQNLVFGQESPRNPLAVIGSEFCGFIRPDSQRIRLLDNVRSFPHRNPSLHWGATPPLRQRLPVKNWHLMPLHLLRCPTWG